MESVKHAAMVTSEALSVISKLKKPDTGLEKLGFEFLKLDEKLSDTVLDQFVQHAKLLKVLKVVGLNLPESDKLNVLELASRILED